MLAPAADSYSRDLTKYPPVIERPSPAALYAIGDIHGDYQRLVRLLIAAHIVPPRPPTRRCQMERRDGHACGHRRHDR